MHPMHITLLSALALAGVFFLVLLFKFIESALQLDRDRKGERAESGTTEQISSANRANPSKSSRRAGNDEEMEMFPLNPPPPALASSENKSSKIQVKVHQHWEKDPNSPGRFKTENEKAGHNQSNKLPKKVLKEDDGSLGKSTKFPPAKRILERRESSPPSYPGDSSRTSLEEEPAGGKGPEGLGKEGNPRKIYYPLESLQNVDEYPDWREGISGGMWTTTDGFGGRKRNQANTLETDSSLVIVTGSTNGKIAGYCVNLVKRKCYFYIYPFDRIPWEGFFLREELVLLVGQEERNSLEKNGKLMEGAEKKQSTSPPEDPHVQNLYFATCLWFESMRKFKTFRLHSLHPGVDGGNGGEGGGQGRGPWMKLLLHCLRCLEGDFKGTSKEERELEEKKEEEEEKQQQRGICMVNRKFYPNHGDDDVGGSSDSSSGGSRELFSPYHMPIHYLLRGELSRFTHFMAEDFAVQRFEGTHNFRVPTGEEPQPTEMYTAFLLRAELTLRQLKTGKRNDYSPQAYRL